MALLRVLPGDIRIDLAGREQDDLLDLLADRGIPLESECGGEGTCGKCLVELVEGGLADLSGARAEPVRDNLFLACQSRPEGDCVIRVSAPGRASAEMIERLVAGVPGEGCACGPRERLGLAVDVGTTTVVALLADLDSGEPLAVESDTNPQRAYGADVISRIAYSLGEHDGRSGTDILQEAAAGCVDRLAARVCEKAGQDPDLILSVVCVGNTAMQHLLLGVTPRRLGVAPYVAEFSEAGPVPAGDLGIPLRRATLRFLPNIASFVGADAVACLLVIERREHGERALMVDMGTNTEMALLDRGSRVACSAAAGPAFEGAHLEHGMRALPGAVNRVSVKDGHLSYGTIGGLPASGICGSGIVDAVASLRRIGVVDEDGRMPGTAEYVLVPPGESATGRAVTVTRNDIREVQLVKGSIATGLKFLVERRGLDFEDIGRVYVAGAFGNYLDVENARSIGLVPDLPAARFRSIGDGALEGAFLCLVSGEVQLERAREIAGETEHLELAARQDFQRVFIESLALRGYRSSAGVSRETG